MNDLKSEPATMTAVIQIKRKDTGKVEEHKLVLTPLPEPQTEKQQENEDGRNP